MLNWEPNERKTAYELWENGVVLCPNCGREMNENAEYRAYYCYCRLRVSAEYVDELKRKAAYFQASVDGSSRPRLFIPGHEISRIMETGQVPEVVIHERTTSEITTAQENWDE